MNGKAMTLFFLVLLILTSGCAGRPLFSVEVFLTPTFTPIASDPIDVQPTLPPASTPDLPEPMSTPESPGLSNNSAVTMPPDFSPILYGKKYDANTYFFLLGGIEAGQWLKPDEAAARFGSEQEYLVHTLAQESFPVHGHAPNFSPVNNEYFIGTDISLDETGMVGVLDGWPVRQGNPQELSPDQEVYRQVVLDWLKEAGLSDPQLDDLHIFRVDLEGDGADEIFIRATRLRSQHLTRAGDYSIVLMRKVLGNDAVTLPIVADVYQSAQAESTWPRAYSLANFIDLNKDGILEVVVEFEHWEGDGAILYQVDGQEIIQIP